MKVRAYDLVTILSQVDLVKSSKLLTQEQKHLVYKDMLTDLPMEMFCSGLKNTRAAVTEVLNKEIQSSETAKSPEKKVTPKAKSTPSKRSKK